MSEQAGHIFERDIRNVIENTMKDLKEEDLDRAVSLMQSADSLYIMSMRDGFSLAYYAFASWGRLRRDIRLLRFTGMEYPEEMVSMKRGRMRRLFAFPRFTSLAIHLLEWMKKRQVKVILVTSATFVAAREYAEINILPCRVRTASYQNSHVAPICLINYFGTMALTAENYDEAAELLRDTEELLGLAFTSEIKQKESQRERKKPGDCFFRSLTLMTVTCARSVQVNVCVRSKEQMLN